MDQSLKSPILSALDDAFHAMAALSRSPAAARADLYPPYNAKIARTEAAAVDELVIHASFRDIAPAMDPESRCKRKERKPISRFRVRR